MVATIASLRFDLVMQAERQQPIGEAYADVLVRTAAAQSAKHIETLCLMVAQLGHSVSPGNAN